MSAHRLALTVDVEEWFHSGRWVSGTAAGAAAVSSSPEDATGVVPLTRALLDLFGRRRLRATFFVLGAVARRRPGLVVEIAARGHEVACHGQDHVDMTQLARWASPPLWSAARGGWPS